MSRRTVHILNGDVLRLTLPHTITGKRITLREAFIEGPVTPSIDETFWGKRTTFYQRTYGIATEEYKLKTEDELNKIPQVLRDAHVHLWFEQDAFCQVNLWFSCKMLIQRKFSGKAYLVLPKNEPFKWNGFGDLNVQELGECLKGRILLSPRELRYLSNCWEYFANGHYTQLKSKYAHLNHLLPYSDLVFNLLKDVKRNGLLETEITNFINNQETSLFQDFFPYFHEKYGALGLGDMQVNRVFEQTKIQLSAKIEPAKSDDCDKLTKIAKLSKAYWGYPTEWLKLWEQELTITAAMIETGSYSVLSIEEKKVGFAGFAENEKGKYTLEHFWLITEYIGKGLGTMLYMHIEKNLENPAKIAVTSDPNTKDFYEKLGYVYQHEIESKPEGRTLPFLIKEI